MKEKTFVMEGFEESYIRSQREKISPINAILEICDNAIDAKAKNISIVHKDGSLFISDDGIGFSKTALQKFAKTVTSHITKNPKSIGVRGVGLKNAFFVLSNLDKETCVPVEIRTKTSKDVGYHLTWNIKKNDKQRCVADRYLNKETCGTDIIIDSVIDFDETECILAISKAYALFGGKINITFNKKKLYFNDKCYLDILNNDIKKDGCYFKKNIAFNVKTVNATNPSTLDSISFKVVTLYITKAAIDQDNLESQRGACYSDYGLYTLYNNRYINYGGNGSTMFARNGGARGGKNGIRLLLILNQSHANVFGIESDKNCGITPLKNNKNLKEYLLDNDPNNMSVYDLLEFNFSKMNQVCYKERSIKNGCGPLNINSFIDIFENKYKNKESLIMKRYPEIDCADDLEHIIKGFKDSLSLNGKDYLYRIYKMLASGRFGTMSRKNLDNFIREFYIETFGNANKEYSMVG